MSIEIRPAESRADRKLFDRLPARLHGGHPAFVPMLDAALAALLDRRRNPFWASAEGCEWIALARGEPAGRIGACRDPALASRVAGCGAVGLFECRDDPEVASALFATAESWLRERGCNRARGPLNYSIHDTAGLLVEGHDTPPTVDTTWNPRHYEGLWRRAGWRGVADLLGAAGMIETGGPERAHRFARLARRRDIVVRPLDLKRFDEEVERFRRVYNAAWDDNWGHVPIGAAEFAYKAKDLKAVLDADLIRIAEKDGEPVGFMLALPDLNVAIRRSGGRLLPLGWLRLLRARHSAARARVVALGVVPRQRRRGIEAFLLSESFQAIGTRYPWAEASWILADNTTMLNGLKIYNLEPYKRWRVYEKELAGANS